MSSSETPPHYQAGRARRLPVLEGKRIPYDAVASLVADGVSNDAVLRLYPTAPVAALQPARELSDLVLAA
jgi:uncharacterized protein (DUF433 family)